MPSCSFVIAISFSSQILSRLIINQCLNFIKLYLSTCLLRMSCLFTKNKRVMRRRDQHVSLFDYKEMTVHNNSKQLIKTDKNSITRYQHRPLKISNLYIYKSSIKSNPPQFYIQGNGLESENGNKHCLIYVIEVKKLIVP